MLVWALAAPAAEASSRQAAQPPARPTCADWHECRQMALDAAARQDYETFHDLAWRTVQVGPASDPDLMYLLARAQSLSGRPHDAFVMLERLADKGVRTDAATNDDFRRVRALAGWPALADASGRASADPSATATVAPEPAPAPPAPTPAPAVPLAPPAPIAAPPDVAETATTPGAPPVPMPITEAPAEEAARFSTEPFAPGGLAYDGVSRRFVFGDLEARKLKIVAEGTHYTVNLVSAPSAGFHDVMALEIDTRRGDLWVVSAAADGAAAALHKLQLVSGRPLASFEAPAALEPMVFADVAVTPAGVALVLDSLGRRVLALAPAATTLEVVASLDVEAPVSLAPDGDRAAYVAHRNGVVRVDLKTRTAQPLLTPAGIALDGYDWIRRHRDSLVGVQRLDDGTRRVVRLVLGPGGRVVVGATVIRVSIPAGAGPTSATISGDDLYYLAKVTSDGQGSVTGAPVEIVVERIRLR